MRLRHKFTTALFLLFITPVSIAAQQSAPGLEASDPRFRYDVNAGVDPVSSFSGKRPYPMTTVTSSPVQEVSALFLNTGSKPIKSVSWEYVVFKDAEQKKILRVHSIRSNRTIFPDESVRLKMEGYHLQNSPYEKARVTRIKYADGTVWQGAKTKR
ncbi:MAG: hypothetical protein LC803_00590 [Acidobacteria bacterium]|nr:hypothetical protein [Acidobacteriota bacterium]